MRRGLRNHTTTVKKVCSLQIRRVVGHPQPSSFLMKNKSNLDLWNHFPFPIISPFLYRVFPLMVGESIPLSELGEHSFQLAVIFVFFNIGSNMIWRILATPCLQPQRQAVGMTKRGCFPVLHWKKGPKIIASSLSLLSFFLLCPLPLLSPHYRERLAKWEKTEGGRAISYSPRENFWIEEAFGTACAFISFTETI